MNLNLVTFTGRLAAPIGSNDMGYRALFVVKSTDPNRVDLIPTELSPEHCKAIDAPRVATGTRFHIVGKLVRRFEVATGKSALVVVVTGITKQGEG